MTKDEALATLDECADLSMDRETAHQMADKVLCELLRSLGHGEVAAKFEELDKWYS